MALNIMEYEYSRLVSRETYVTDGLSFDVPLRIHRDLYKEELGALQAQRDWDEQVGPLNGYQGGLGPAFSFIRVTVPECRPERLEITSYANEFAFLYDGKCAAGEFLRALYTDSKLDEMEKLELKSVS
jgi:hypothetical protein